MAGFVRDREWNYAVQDNDLMSAGDRDNNTRIYTHSMAVVILMSDETKLSDGLLALTTDDPL